MSRSRVIRAVALVGVIGASAAAFAGCDDNARAATDEEYVSAICHAIGDIDERMDARFAEIEGEGSEAEPEDLDEIFEQMFLAIGAMADTIANEVGDVTPPDDLREYHDTVIDGMRQLAATFRDTESFEELDEDALATLENLNLDEFPDVEARLEAVAANLPECDGVFDDEAEPAS